MHADEAYFIILMPHNFTHQGARVLPVLNGLTNQHTQRLPSIFYNLAAVQQFVLSHPTSHHTQT
jgi:hypothetical protein